MKIPGRVVRNPKPALAALAIVLIAIGGALPYAVDRLLAHLGWRGLPISPQWLQWPLCALAVGFVTWLMRGLDPPTPKTPIEHLIQRHDDRGSTRVRVPGISMSAPALTDGAGPGADALTAIVSDARAGDVGSCIRRCRDALSARDAALEVRSRVVVELYLTWALCEAGFVGRARDEAERARQAFASLDVPSLVTCGELLLAYVHAVGGQVQAAHDGLARAASSPPGGHLIERDRVVVRAVLAEVEGDTAAAVGLLEFALAHCDEDHDQAAIGRLLRDRGRQHAVRGELEAARACVAKALAAAEKAGDVLLSCSTIALEASLLMTQGRFREAESVLRTAERLATTADVGLLRVDVLNGLGQCAMVLGAADDAAIHFRRARVLAAEAGYTQGSVSALVGLGIAETASGRSSRSAIELARRAVELASEDGDPLGVLLALDGMGRAALQRGDYDVAIDCGERCLAIARSAGAKPAEARTILWLAESYRAQGDTTRAADAYMAATHTFSAMGDADGSARAAVGAAIALERLERLDESVVYVEHALAALVKVPGEDAATLRQTLERYLEEHGHVSRRPDTEAGADLDA